MPSAQYAATCRLGRRNAWCCLAWLTRAGLWAGNCLPDSGPMLLLHAVLLCDCSLWSWAAALHLIVARSAAGRDSQGKLRLSFASPVCSLQLCQHGVLFSAGHRAVFQGSRQCWVQQWRSPAQLSCHPPGHRGCAAPARSRLALTSGVLLLTALRLGAVPCAAPTQLLLLALLGLIRTPWGAAPCLPLTLMFLVLCKTAARVLLFADKIFEIILRVSELGCKVLES